MFIGKTNGKFRTKMTCKQEKVASTRFRPHLCPMDYARIASDLYAELLSWATIGVRLVPRIFVAVLVLVVATVVSRWVSRWLGLGLNRVSGNRSLVNLTRTVARLLIVCVGVFVALGIVGLEKTVTSLLAGAGVIALAIGFAFQDLTANFISGTMIAVAQPIRVGDMVETNGFMGQVLEIKLRSILLDNMQGQTVELPSKDVFQKPIINHSRTGNRRVEVVAGVSYLDDLVRAKHVAQGAVGTLACVLHHRPVEVNYRAFADANIQFTVWFWVDPLQTEAATAQSEAIMAIRAAFAQERILMVFAGHTHDLKHRLDSPEAPLPPA